MLEKLRIAKFRFQLQAKDVLHLSNSNPVSTLRGACGYVFKRTVCMQKRAEDYECATCLLRTGCPYPYIFETQLPPDAEMFRGYFYVPHPFVLSLPFLSKSILKPGETLSLNLTLIGKAIDFLPYFLFVFSKLGEVGIGKGRGKYEMLSVHAVNPLEETEQSIYTENEQIAYDTNLLLTYENFLAKLPPLQESIAKAGRKLIIEFQTPTRLKNRNRLVVNPEFQILIRSLLRRISSLYYFHCGGQWEIDFRELIAKATSVEYAPIDLKWVDWRRYSNRQQAQMKLGGFVGWVRYEGALDEFLLPLLIGQVLHVGKATAFGNGKYILCQEETKTQ
ncbi:TPA: CRISPR system precrRNA processing endoribonuclease RAMP protein Cas6 [Candidatus Poribacteria bacterium]|nr:CRISPR system precrRNA processing endoribonuclease RAMP protein Cas6 [Candidatus Poribacteria bacterium]